MRKRLLSSSLLLLAAVLWGFAFVAQESASDIPPFTLGAYRSAIGFVFLVFTVAIIDKVSHTGRVLISKRGIDVNRHEIIGGIICGIILAGASFLQQMGINSGTEGGKAAFITALYVVMVPIYALALKKRAAPNVWVAVGISVVGFYLLCIKSDFTVSSSDLFCLGGALIFPVHILTIDHFSPKCDGVRMSMIQFFTAAAVNFVMALITEPPMTGAVLLDAILPILYLGIASSGIAYTLQIIGQRNVPPAAASIILSLESVFGVIGGALILGSDMTLREYAGCTVVLLAVILAQLDFSLKKKK